jgi:hypothetical protein
VVALLEGGERRLDVISIRRGDQGKVRQARLVEQVARVGEADVWTQLEAKCKGLAPITTPVGPADCSEAATS